MSGKDMTDYSMEELLPLVAELAERCTGGESSSVTYEKANQLMEAVLYTIRHCCRENELMGGGRAEACEAYRAGLRHLTEIVEQTQERYNELMDFFHAYGNENYHDTATRALSGFFRYYDVRFAPQETLITMDYPVLAVIEGSGIDAVRQYVESIFLEQRFMGRLPDEYVYGILYRFQTDYRKQFYNICNIVLRHILCHMLIEKPLGGEASERDYQMLEEIVRANGREWLEAELAGKLHELIAEKYEADRALEKYLRLAVRESAVELCNAAEWHTLRRTVAL